MKYFLTFILLLSISLGIAQTPMKLTPQGFPSVEFETSNKPFDKLLETSKSWAAFYNKNGYDVFDVSDKQFSIGALKEYAFIDRNLGVTYDYNIKYVLKVTFKESNKFTVDFTVNEIYANEVLTKITTADFFTSEGNLKPDFEEDKFSLEATAERIVKSYSNFIAR